MAKEYNVSINNHFICKFSNEKKLIEFVNNYATMCHLCNIKTPEYTRLPYSETNPITKNKFWTYNHGYRIDIRTVPDTYEYKYLYDFYNGWNIQYIELRSDINKLR